MYRLYWAPGTAAFGPHAVLEEAGLDYEIVEIDIQAEAHTGPDYLAINPVGRVPALVLPDGQVVTETGAIMLYLAERHDAGALAPAPGDPQRGRFLRWLFHFSNTLQTDNKRYHYPRRYSTEPAHAPAIRARATGALMDSWRPVDDHLAAGGPFMLGDRFSLLDIYLAMMASWFEPPADLLTRFPAVGRCHDLVMARPAVRRCLDRRGASG